MQWSLDIVLLQSSIARRLYKEGDNKYGWMKNLYILGWGAASEIYSEEDERYGNKKGNDTVGTHYSEPTTHYPEPSAQNPLETQQKIYLEARVTSIV